MAETRLFGLTTSELRAELEQLRRRRLELVLESHAAVARGELIIDEAVSGFDCSRANYYRLLKIARYQLEGRTGDGRHNRLPTIRGTRP